MRIAIVGSGIAGLTAAYMLHRCHEVTVFEADDRVGGHAHTVELEHGGKRLQLDTGFIVFNDRNYPSFERLMRSLGVAWKPSDMSFSVSDGRGFEYSSRSLDGVFARRSHLLSPSFVRMLAEIPRFQRAARRLVKSGDDTTSLRLWLRSQGLSDGFTERLLVPQVSAVWSADPGQLWSLPALFVAQFFENHGMLSLRGRPHWRTIESGSASYVRALTKPFGHRIHTGTPVHSVSRGPDGVVLHVQGAEPLCFDQVVLATHSDEALAILADPSEREREILSLIPYQKNEAILHTDRALLPRRRRAWASWNYHLLDQPPGRTTVTYHLNRLQQFKSEREFCVTLNMSDRIDPAQIIKRIAYAHPVYTPAGVAAQERVREISSAGRRTHFCGAYWGWGFHEDGVRSGLRVAESLGARS